MKLPRAPFALLFAAAALPAPADEDGAFLGPAPGSLQVSNESGSLSFGLAGLLDVESYSIRDAAPGLLFADDSFVNPRLTLFGDASVGEHLGVFLQGRADRAFDPSEHGSDVRLDEAFVRWGWEGHDDPDHAAHGWSLAVQGGKFATPLGNFVPRHDSMKNPLVRAPMPYDHVTVIDDYAAPAANQKLVDWRDLPDRKTQWLTMLWGPVYHTGVMALGSAGRFDLRAAVTNAAPSERPSQWAWQDDDRDALAYSARLGWNPFLGFKTGLNWASGAYFKKEAESTFRPGHERDDYPQRLVGADFEYGIGHLVLFAEIYRSAWEVPNVSGDVQAVAYYVEPKYALFPGFYLAGRWNQMVFSEIRDAAGNDRTWDRDAWRAELGAGYFIYVNLLAKAQYEWNGSDGPNDADDNVLSLSLSLSF